MCDKLKKFGLTRADEEVCQSNTVTRSKQYVDGTHTNTVEFALITATWQRDSAKSLPAYLDDVEAHSF